MTNVEGGSMSIGTTAGRGGGVAVASGVHGSRGVAHGSEMGLSHQMSISSEGRLSTPHSSHSLIDTKAGGQHIPSEHPMKGTIDLGAMYGRPQGRKGETSHLSPTKERTTPRVSLKGKLEGVTSSPKSADTYRTDEKVGKLPTIHDPQGFIEVHPVPSPKVKEGDKAERVAEVPRNETPSEVVGRITGKATPENNAAKESVRVVLDKEALRQKVEASRRGSRQENVGPEAITPRVEAVKEMKLETVANTDTVPEKVKEKASQHVSREQLDEIREAYLKEHVLHLTTQQSKVEASAMRGESRTHPLATVSTKEGQNLVLPAGMAAEAFTADLERAVILERIAQELKDTAPEGSDWTTIDPRELALDSADYGLERTGVKNAVITAVEIGQEQAEEEAETEVPTTYEQEMVEVDADTQSPMEEVNEVTPRPEAEVEVVTYLDDEMVQLSDEQVDEEAIVASEESEQAAEIEVGDEQISSLIPQSTQVQQSMLPEEEIVETLIEQDDVANEIRLAYLKAAIEATAKAKEEAGEIPEVNGVEVVELMPSDDMQPEEVQGQEVLSLPIEDGSYKQLLADVSHMGTLSVAQAEAKASHLVQKDTASREVTIYEHVTPELTETEHQNVLDQSPRGRQRAA